MASIIAVLGCLVMLASLLRKRLGHATVGLAIITVGTFLK